MSDILVSTVVPVYNASSTIITCIDSIVHELEKVDFSWELILVNDGSTDDSLKLMESYRQHSPYKSNIHVFSQVNSGVSSARNLGMAKAKGAYIAFNDSDDEWIPGRMITMISFLRNDPAIMLLAGIYWPVRFGSYGDFDIKEISVNRQIFRNHFYPPTVIFKRSLLFKYGYFDEFMTHAEDMFYFSSICAREKSCLCNVQAARSILNKLSYGQSGLSANLWKMEKGELKCISNLYKRKDITLFFFIFAYFFSLLKYMIRFVIVAYRSLIS